MASILNALFSGRSGMTSHGLAIATIADNIANVSTPGYKQAVAQFEDLIAGGQTSDTVIGSGSALSRVTQVNSQGTIEFTGNPLDMAIDGNGFFALADGAQRFYSRAGNFRIDASGYLVNQRDLAVLGFPSGGSGALEPINVNTVSQDSVATENITITGNLDASSSTITGAQLTALDAATRVAGNAPPTTEATTYANINALAEFSTIVPVFDSLGQSHNVTVFFFHTGLNAWDARAYVNSEDVDPSGTRTGYPRLLANASGSGDINLNFNGDGTRSNAPASGAYDLTIIAPQNATFAGIDWANGADSSTVHLTLSPFTQFSASSNILSIAQDGEGVGSVTSIAIEANGDIYAQLDNGQRAQVGTLALVNFANPEGLARQGNSLLQKTSDSGEPIVGTPKSGTLGGIQSGAIELSTVDLATEFVNLIRMQKGFQANAKSISTANQLLDLTFQLS